MPEIRRLTMAELIADGAVHLVGICLGITATVILAVTMWDVADRARQVTVMIYATCLMTMLICSALYNMLAKDHKSGILRRLDHAAIFLMIAGTYTPLAAIIIGGWTGSILLAIV